MSSGCRNPGGRHANGSVRLRGALGHKGLGAEQVLILPTDCRTPPYSTTSAQYAMPPSGAYAADAGVRRSYCPAARKVATCITQLPDWLAAAA